MIDNQHSCLKCLARALRAETYVVNTEDGELEFDIEYARSIVTDGRLAVQLEKPLHAAVLHLIQPDGIMEAHLNHLSEQDLQTPGIRAWRTASNGQVQWQVIDGGHRATRTWLDSRPFSVFDLTEEETERCLIVYRLQYHRLVEIPFSLPEHVYAKGVAGPRGRCFSFYHRGMGELGRIFLIEVGSQFSVTYEAFKYGNQKDMHVRERLFQAVMEQVKRFTSSQR